MIEYVPAYDWVMSSRIVVDDNGEKLLFTDHVSEKIEAHGKKQVKHLYYLFTLQINYIRPPL